ncbi:hypothetical protein TH30_01810 [Thalassospira profundimaris]|uniref:Uncharacterized protein n=1 Tax=Thalassospira profundimaris TaxID=502049 RepID=A0A367X8G8_9PROT|nr:hypothetical protein TH30_01810 [Thalassospira profundimaris]
MQLKLTAREICAKKQKISQIRPGRDPNQVFRLIVAFGQKKGVRPGGRTGRQRSDDLEREER